jgi:hypothetical protein
MAEDVHTKLQQKLKDAISGGEWRRAPGSTDLPKNLCELIDNIPVYGRSSPIVQLHTSCVLDALKNGNLGDAVEPGPYNTKNFSKEGTTYYDGPAKHYRGLLFGSAPEYSKIADLRTTMEGTENTLKGSWEDILVTFIAEIARQNLGGLDTRYLAKLKETEIKLAFDKYDRALRRAFNAGYLWVFTNTYDSTATKLGKVLGDDRGEAARKKLKIAIKNGRFTAEVEAGLNSGTDSATLVIWFLFNLWIILKALNEPDVAAAITEFKTAGLRVPDQVGASTWWTGNTDWAAFGVKEVYNKGKDALSAKTMPARIFFKNKPSDQFNYTRSHCESFTRFTKNYSKYAKEKYVP